MPTSLASRVSGPVFTPTDADYAPEIAAFNLAVMHTPELVVGATSVDDLAEAVRFARERGMPVSVQGAGHGAYVPVASGLLISTRRMAQVRIDVPTRTAFIGGGACWAPVVDAAVEHGLFPVTGSSPTVGVAGYLLGGGLGPLARSHGFSSDFLVGATLVTGSGEVVDTDDHPELLWALRGGKYTGALVAELRVRLVEQRMLYAGSLFFEEQHREQAFRRWVDWTATADPRVTTSVGFLRYPPLNVVPAPLRGRRLMVLCFTYPGDPAEGARLAAPLRAAAPLYIDDLGELPCRDVARIHNDPTQPMPAWVSGLALDRVDPDFATAFLTQVLDTPFTGVQIRHLGEATRRDVADGSAVGGRSASFVMSYASADTSLFAQVLPDASARLMDALGPWTCAENNINFIGRPRSAEHFATAWPAATLARLARVQERYDPQGTFGHHA